MTCTSRIPPELWRKIFELATYTPGLLNCSPSRSDLPSAIAAQQEVRLLVESLATKRSLVQVCKTWDILATEFLYQSVLITRVETLPALLRALKRRSQLSGASRARPGWWTKRLDVLLTDNSCEATDYTLLADVIRHFSNLSIVTLSIPIRPLSGSSSRQLPIEIITSLAETCGPSLRSFDCSDSAIRPCREDLMVLLTACPNLRVLRCPKCSPTPGNRSPRSRMDVPIMEKLESISLMSVFLRDYLPRDKHANCLPALRQLTYDCIPPPFFDHAWRSFVKLSCSAVTSVTLDFCLQPGDALQDEFDLLAECCPALDKLIIYFHSWLDFVKFLVLPPSISHLCIHSKLQKPASFHYGSLVVALVTLTAPELKSIRILHSSAVKEFRKSLEPLLVGDIVGLASRRFRVQDEEDSILCTAI
ncbi:hypothetical protein V8B97DRAFT_1871745 [Scleroderma yunnanense]